MKLRVALGCDPSGYEMRDALVKHLETLGYATAIFDSPTEPPNFDYPDVAHLVCQSITNQQADLGILICGTGLGMSMTANRYRGIRAALATTEFHAKLSREHNSANVLCLGARVTAPIFAIAILDAFLQTPAATAERHLRRIANIELPNTQE